MICDDVAYREDYVDYLIEYNGETETVLDIYKDTGCVNFIDERFAVLYRPKPDDYMESFSRLEYTLFPKLYGLMDTSSVEAVGAVNVQQENILGLTGKNIIIGIIDTGIDKLELENQIFISYLKSIGINVDIQPTSATPGSVKNSNIVEPTVFYRYEVTGDNTPKIFSETEWKELQERITKMIKLLIN